MSLSTLPWEPIGTVGLCVFFTVLILRGKLVPRATVDAMMSDLRMQITNLERRFAARDSTVAELTTQNSTLMIQAELWDKVLKPATKAKSSKEADHVAPVRE